MIFNERVDLRPPGFIMMESLAEPGAEASAVEGPDFASEAETAVCAVLPECALSA